MARLLLTTLWVINRERRRVMRARARGDYEVRPNITVLIAVLRDFRMTAVELGGLLIKLGQFLSSRADLLPPEALAELSSLQDEVPAEPIEAIQGMIERELGPLSTIFARIEPLPAGSASLGQVHRAQLLDGRTVAVKVQRPGIGRIIRTDLGALSFVLRIVRIFAPNADEMVDTRGLYREISRIVQEELDYQREGRYAERFARLFADAPDIVVPGVIWDYSTRRVLTLEWIDGIKVTEVDALTAANVDRAAVAHRLIETYFKQVLEVGFFHADPHPGNILVLPQPDGPVRLAFLDFGMMGTITNRMREGLRDGFLGVMQQDAALVVRGLDRLGFLGETARRDVIEQAVAQMLAQFSNLPFGQIREVDPRDVAGDAEALLYEQPLRLPVQFAFLGRALGMLLGLSTALSPTFNFMDVASPYASQFIRADGLDGILRLLGVDSMNQLGRDLLREGIAMGRSVSALPRTLERVLERAEAGDLRLVIESPGLLTRSYTSLKQGTSRGALNRPVPAWVPLSVAGILAITLVMRRRGIGD